MRHLTFKVTMIGTLLAAGSSLPDCSIASPWSLSAENTSKFEYYDAGGDRSASPYQYRSGQFYDDLNLQLSRRFSQYEQFSTGFSLLFNDSDYRSSKHGVVPERLNLLWEKGDLSLPFRLQAGDIYPFLSLRSLQRPIKGVTLDLQPESGSARMRNSLLMFTGAGFDGYREIRPSQDLFTGISWLTEYADYGNFKASFLHNYRAAASLNGILLPVRNQYLASIAAEKKISFLSTQMIGLEAEADRFWGDYYDSYSGMQQNKSDMGWFGQLRGETGTPLTYRLRFEKYGEHYRPNGASVTPDYENIEAHVGWRLKGGLDIRGRYYHVRNWVSTLATVTSHVGGINMNGPLAFGVLPAMTVNVDMFAQEDKSENDAVYRVSQSAKMNLAMPLGIWSGRLGLSAVQNRDYRSASGRITQNLEATLGGATKLAMAGFKGSFSPSLVLRRATTNPVWTDAYGMNLGIQLAQAGHQIGLNGSLLRQEYQASAISSDFNGSASATYRFTKGGHTIGLDADYAYRGPEPGSATNSYRFGISYTIRFDKPAEVTFAAASASLFDGKETSGLRPTARPASGDSLFIGKTIAEARQELTNIGITGAVELPGVLVYETQLLDTLNQRQRLAIVHKDGRIVKTVLIVAFDDTGDLRTVKQTYELARSTFMQRFGRPTTVRDSGDITPYFVQDLQSGRLVRLMEWRTGNSSIRFGIPQRLDRQIRMELHTGTNLPPLDDPYWSLDEVP